MPLLWTRRLGEKSLLAEGDKCRVKVVKHESERGAAMIVATLVAGFVLIPMIALAIDVGIMYWVDAKLSAAVDAEALSTARALNQGNTQAQTVGEQYFSANFPSGLLNTSLVGGVPVPTITQTSTHLRTVTATASVNVPLYFLRLLHVNTGTVSATGTATRKDSNIILVLDRSNSMNTAATPSACAAMVAAAQNFVSQFVDGRDQLGLVTFQTGANIDYAPTLSFKTASPSLSSVLGTLVCAGDTSTAQGLTLSYQQIKNVINQPGALNVILFFTDGEPNAINATYPARTQADVRCDPNFTSSCSSTISVDSGCTGPTYSGIFGDGSAENWPLNQYGYTVAVLSPTGVSISNGSNPTTISASGCNFSSSNWQTSVYGRQDIAYIPTQDAYGNSTVDNGYKAVDYFTSGPYSGQIRPDMPRTARYVAFNAADSIGQTIRNDTTYGILTYTIGLTGNEPMPMDQDFMERLANDPRASNYDSTKAQGQFILANNSAEMAQAFNTIAGEIIRLAK